MKRRAFTMMEIIVVVVIIVLMLGIAVPAFRYITGSRSVDAAQNGIAATLSQARSTAIGLHHPVGLVILRDLASNRVGLGLVTKPEFTPYSDNAQYFDSQSFTYDKNRQQVPMESFVTYNGGYYVCATPTTSGTKPPSGGWVQVRADTVTLVPEKTFMYLQSGVGAATLNGYNVIPNSSPPQASDRYLGTGVIMFGANGTLDTNFFYSIDYDASKKAGTRLGNLVAQQQNTLVGQIGLALYDWEAFRGNGYDLRDSIVMGTSYTAAWSNPSAPREDLEEQWIDKNSLTLLVNRYTGALIRGE